MDEEGVEGDGFLHVQQSPPRCHGLGQRVLLGPEEGAGLTAHGHPLQVRCVLDGADEVGKLNQKNLCHPDKPASGVASSPDT